MYKYDIILMVNNLQYKVGGKFMEKSLVLIKPDAVRKNIIGNIIGIYEKQGLKVINLKMGLVKEKIAEEPSAVHLYPTKDNVALPLLTHRDAYNMFDAR